VAAGNAVRARFASDNLAAAVADLAPVVTALSTRVQALEETNKLLVEQNKALREDTQAILSLLLQQGSSSGSNTSASSRSSKAASATVQAQEAPTTTAPVAEAAEAASTTTTEQKRGARPPRSPYLLQHSMDALSFFCLANQLELHDITRFGGNAGDKREARRALQCQTYLLNFASTVDKAFLALLPPLQRDSTYQSHNERVMEIGRRVLKEGLAELEANEKAARAIINDQRVTKDKGSNTGAIAKRLDWLALTDEGRQKEMKVAAASAAAKAQKRGTTGDKKTKRPSSFSSSSSIASSSSSSAEITAKKSKLSTQLSLDSVLIPKPAAAAAAAPPPRSIFGSFFGLKSVI